ncbi:hypothetical protein BZG36_04238 [Bifiguratus adelaidae]|uniref:DUF885 domain-containing protein n=1 Tax=Bifiguratus adelaidae TaxID=1938954 RepID=A0A261Y0Y6_9FUNG|nr:hypothetical protein BZG36_04238 [Bifiguratus adelaidae]
MAIDDTMDFATTLNGLKDEYVDTVFYKSPEAGLMYGFQTYQDLISHCSRESFESYWKKLEGLLQRAKEIDDTHLSALQKGELTHFIGTVTKDLTGRECWEYEMPSNHMTGLLAEYAFLPSIQPLNNEKDLENYKKRLSQMPDVLKTELIEAMRYGKSKGIMPNKQTIEIMIKMCKQQEVEDLSKSPFNLTEKLEEAKLPKDALFESLSALPPAYKAVREFLEEEYLPAARTHAGIYGLPNHDKVYETMIFASTTVKMSPTELHELGKKEVQRITELMEETKKKVGFAGTLQKFFVAIQDSKKYPQLHLGSREEVLKNYDAIFASINKKLPDYFSHFPKRQCVIKASPAFREANDPMAYYMPAGTDGEPGQFFINMALHAKRAVHMASALALHEANPGHHHQVSLYNDAENRHIFDKIAQTTAYLEGWGLYSEYLGEEMGMYEDPFQYFGRLELEMHRALRLVVDSGLHAFDWTVEQALEYMKIHESLSEDELRAEIFRYTVMPGQALAYKVGELKIKELRKLAEEQLGSRFDVKDFHDAVLSNSTTLGALESTVREWIRSVSQ